MGCKQFAANSCFLVFANAAPSIGTAVVHGFSDFSAAPLRRAGRLLLLFLRSRFLYALLTFARFFSSGFSR